LAFASQVQAMTIAPMRFDFLFNKLSDAKLTALISEASFPLPRLSDLSRRPGSSSPARVDSGYNQ